MKECARCNVDKDDSEFYKSDTSSDGFGSWCKKCHSEYRMQWRVVNAGRTTDKKGKVIDVKAYNREYGRKRRQNMPVEERREKDRLKYAKSREKELSDLKLADPIAYERKVNWGNKAKLKRENALLWKDTQDVRDCVSKARTSNRRAKAYNAAGKVTALDIHRMMVEQEGLCKSCGGSILRAFHLDHIVSLVSGGSNQNWNLQLLCPYCNVKKGGFDLVL